MHGADLSLNVRIVVKYTVRVSIGTATKVRKIVLFGKCKRAIHKIRCIYMSIEQVLSKCLMRNAH